MMSTSSGYAVHMSDVIGLESSRCHASYLTSKLPPTVLIQQLMRERVQSRNRCWQPEALDDHTLPYGPPPKL